MVLNKTEKKVLYLDTNIDPSNPVTESLRKFNFKVGASDSFEEAI